MWVIQRRRCEVTWLEVVNKNLLLKSRQNTDTGVNSGRLLRMSSCVRRNEGYNLSDEDETVERGQTAGKRG